MIVEHQHTNISASFRLAGIGCLLLFISAQAAAQPTVTGFNERNLKITADGQGVQVTLIGRELEALKSAVVTQNNRSTRAVQAFLGRGQGSRRTLQIAAQRTAQPGWYEIVFVTAKGEKIVLSRAFFIDLPVIATKSARLGVAQVSKPVATTNQGQRQQIIAKPSKKKPLGEIKQSGKLVGTPGSQSGGGVSYDPAKQYKDKITGKLASIPDGPDITSWGPKQNLKVGDIMFFEGNNLQPDIKIRLGQEFFPIISRTSTRVEARIPNSTNLVGHPLWTHYALNANNELASHFVVAKRLPTVSNFSYEWRFNSQRFGDIFIVTIELSNVYYEKVSLTVIDNSMSSTDCKVDALEPWRVSRISHLPSANPTGMTGVLNPGLDFKVRQTFAVQFRDFDQPRLDSCPIHVKMLKHNPDGSAELVNWHRLGDVEFADVEIYEIRNTHDLVGFKEFYPVLLLGNPAVCKGTSHPALGQGTSYQVGAIKEEGGDLVFRVRSGPLGAECVWATPEISLRASWRVMSAQWAEVLDPPVLGTIASNDPPGCRVSKWGGPPRSRSLAGGKYDGMEFRDDLWIRGSGTRPWDLMRRFEILVQCNKNLSNGYGAEAHLQVITLEGPAGLSWQDAFGSVQPRALPPGK